MSEHATIEYEITLKVTVPAGQPEGTIKPWDERFYSSLPAVIEVPRAQRITPGVAYGGPR